MKSAHCNCISGILGLCKHTSALVCFINSERTESCTDNLQEWQKPSQKCQALYPKGETIESLFKLTPFPPPTFEPEAEKLENFVSLLKLHMKQMVCFSSHFPLNQVMLILLQHNSTTHQILWKNYFFLNNQHIGAKLL